MTTNENAQMDSTEKLDYTVADLNSFASAILSTLVDDGEVDHETALRMKMFFNTVIDLALSHKDEADELLEKIKEMESEEGLPKDFDILKAAEDLKNDYLS